MTLVPARRRHRYGSRGTVLFAANRTAHTPRHVIKRGIPAAELREKVRRRMPLTKAGTTGQDERVLPEFVAQFIDFQVAHMGTVQISRRPLKYVFPWRTRQNMSVADGNSGYSTFGG